MSLDYKILGQELVSYTIEEGITDTTSYYVSYEETNVPSYFALSTNGNFSYSTDLVTWTAGSNILAEGPFSGLTYADNKIIVLSPSTASHSTNGVAWTASPLPNFASEGTYFSVAYGGGRFVTVGFNSSTAAYSTDGVSWTQASLPQFSSWSSVAYGDNKFVATSFSPVAAYSTDGITWTQSSLPISIGLSITYGDGKFVGLGVNTSTVIYSTNGISWSQASLPTSSEWRSVTYGDGKFVAVGFSPSVAVYSTNGITWSQSTLPGSFFWNSVTHGNNGFLAVSFSSTSAYSTDGITWTQTTIQPDSASWRDVVYGQIPQLTETLNIIGGQGTTQTEEFLPRTIYTVPEGKQTTVTSVYVANHDESESTYDFAVVPAGEELSLKHHIRWDMPVAGKDFEVINTKITMSAGDSLVIFPSTVDTVSVTAFGVEK